MYAPWHSTQTTTIGNSMKNLSLKKVSKKALSSSILENMTSPFNSNVARVYIEKWSKI